MILIAAVSAKFIVTILVEVVVVMVLLWVLGRRACGASDGRDEEEDVHNYNYGETNTTPNMKI